jgi:ABC-type nickel/cobalt efflux system permease component RcnA
VQITSDDVLVLALLRLQQLLHLDHTLSEQVLHLVLLHLILILHCWQLVRWWRPLASWLAVVRRPEVSPILTETALWNDSP